MTTAPKSPRLPKATVRVDYGKAEHFEGTVMEPRDLLLEMNPGEEGVTPEMQYYREDRPEEGKLLYARLHPAGRRGKIQPN